jgi:DNA-binding transcriptional MerR regulator
VSHDKIPQLALPKLAFREKEAAKILGVSPRTLWNWEQDGLIQAIRRARVKLYPLSSLEAFLAAKGDA